MGKKKRKRAEPTGPPSAPEWIVTFTDMISLLVTFFVLLMTFSSMEEYDLLKVASFLQGREGVMSSTGFVAPELPDEDLLSATDILRGAASPHTRPPDKLPDSIEEMGQKMTEQHLGLELERVADGLVLDFGRQASFAPGSATPNPDLTKSLRELGKVLENYPHLVVVEGFTDAGFLPTPTYPDAEAMGFARAAAAARILLDTSDMPPQLMQVASGGDRAPRGDDATATGRQLNRRIEVRIVALSKLRADHLTAQEERASRAQR